jgi:hypothetical protein
MSALLEGWATGPYERLTSREMFGHYLLGPDLETGLYLGHRRPEYPGTDALSLSVSPQALRWLETAEPTLGWVFGEGIRLGHPRFLRALAEKTELTVVHLAVDPILATHRRLQRAGKSLSEKYCKTATATAASAAEACREAGIQVLELDGSRSAQDLAEEVHGKG